MSDSPLDAIDAVSPELGAVTRQLVASVGALDVRVPYRAAMVPATDLRPLVDAVKADVEGFVRALLSAAEAEQARGDLDLDGVTVPEGGVGVIDGNGARVGDESERPDSAPHDLAPAVEDTGATESAAPGPGPEVAPVPNAAGSVPDPAAVNEAGETVL